jgi:hypothetical protein
MIRERRIANRGYGSHFCMRCSLFTFRFPPEAEKE